MADTQNQSLSPQGYNIYDDPVNTNPFWGDDGEADPSIYQRLTALENDVDNLESDKLDASDIANYYTKTETDTIINNLPSMNPANYYTKTEIDTVNATYDLTIKNYVATNYYNKTETDNKLAAKANISAFNNYYNKSEIDAMQASDDGRLDDLELTVSNHTSALTDMDTALGNMSETVNDLDSDVADAVADVSALNTRMGTAETAINNRYTKTEIDNMFDSYYTKAEIDDILGDILDELEVI